MIQSGVQSIKLFNADSTIFSYVSATEITDPGTDYIELTFIDNRPNFKFTISKRQRVSKCFNYQIDFMVFLLSQTLISQLKNINGFLPLVKFLNGEEYFYNTPFYLNKNSFDSNKTGVYQAQMISEGFSKFRQLTITDKPWILDTNYWDDDGIWKDEKTWND